MEAHRCQAEMFHSYEPNLAVRSLRAANLPGAKAEKLASYAMFCMSTTGGGGGSPAGQPLLAHSFATLGRSELKSKMCTFAPIQL